MTLTLNISNNEIKIVKKSIKSKIDSNGGAAPWMIGRTVLSTKTQIFVNGEYAFDFPFCLKKHNKGGFVAKNQIDQLLSYIE